jgi:hypothetical protein
MDELFYGQNGGIGLSHRLTHFRCKLHLLVVHGSVRLYCLRHNDMVAWATQAGKASVAMLCQENQPHTIGHPAIEKATRLPDGYCHGFAV